MLRLYRLQKRRQALLACFTAVAVASEHMRQEYLRHGVPAERLHLLPLFPPGGVPDETPPAGRPGQGRVLMVGRLTALKGGRLLVSALRDASAALGRPLTLVLAGDGPERGPIRELAGRLGVPVEEHGWVGSAERAALFRGADLLAVPSVWPEPFALVGIEAGCVGLPAVAFAVGGIGDWLRPGETGEAAPGDRPTAAGLAAAIGRALRDPAHLRRLGEGAWRLARRFTPAAHLERLEEVLAGAARG
jgi:glycosyltransferase involved in cell wall biosynthesis